MTRKLSDSEKLEQDRERKEFDKKRERDGLNALNKIANMMYDKGEFNGLRVGQIISNAWWKAKGSYITELELFNIENEQLLKMLEDFIRG